MHIQKIVPSVVALSMLTGCATMFDGGSHSMNVRPSQGEKVKVEITSDNGPQTITIPAVVNVPRSKKDLYIAVKDDCYEGSSQVVQSEITPAFFVNFITVFGLTGTTVDTSNGNAWTYDDTVIVSTDKKDSCK